MNWFQMLREGGYLIIFIMNLIQMLREGGRRAYKPIMCVGRGMFGRSSDIYAIEIFESGPYVIIPSDKICEGKSFC